MITTLTLIAIVLVVLLAIMSKLPTIPRDPSGGILSALLWVGAILLIRYLTIRFV